MRRVLLLILICCFVGCSSEKPEPVATQDEVTLTPVDDVAVMSAIKERAGKVVVVNMWATWCEPCVDEFPELVELYNKYKDDGLDVIAVSHDFDAQIESNLKPFIKAQKANFTHFLQNGQVMQDFIDGIESEWLGTLPATIVYDKQGKKAAFISGRFNKEELESIITGLLY